jgi:kynurenine formamidase
MEAHGLVMESLEVLGMKVRIIDLSDRLDNSTSDFEFNRHHIDYIDHRQTVSTGEKVLGIKPEHWPDRLAWAAENVNLSTHSGTHVDAPYHYGPTSNAAPARTIDEVPLRWCFGDGVLLDMTHKRQGGGITAYDVRAALERIGYRIKPYDIVLVRTDVSKRFKDRGYENLHPGLRRDATEWLIDQGVRLIGIDAWGIDRPFSLMVEEANRGDPGQLWESHLLGREKEYSQIEKLCNLDQIPAPYGFAVAALPIKLAGASAAWARVVAILLDQGSRATVAE